MTCNLELTTADVELPRKHRHTPRPCGRQHPHGRVKPLGIGDIDDVKKRHIYDVWRWQVNVLSSGGT